ncbi:MAG: hypothetical protein NTV38_04235 [Chloroflexi bacterium]|nr:hypothetical protein [Chloroflexota bacterium]
MRLIRKPEGIEFPKNKSPDTGKYIDEESVRVGILNRVLLEHAQENIWRSWQLFSDELCSCAVSYVPIFIDIDNEDPNPNIENAYTLTRDCLDFIEGMTQYHIPDSLRVVFSGKKGFHIEARQNETVDNQSIRMTILNGLNKMGLEHPWGNTNSFINGTIDPGHDFIRLTGSIYSWKEDEILRRRKVIQLTIDEFRRSHVKKIIERSEVS